MNDLERLLINAGMTEEKVPGIIKNRIAQLVAKQIAGAAAATKNDHPDYEVDHRFLSSFSKRLAAHITNILPQIIRQMDPISDKQTPLE